MKKIFAILPLALTLVSTCAQIPIGTFRDWLPKHTFFSVTQGADYAYAASTGAILYVDKSNGNVNSWTKTDNLSEGSVSGCYFSQENNVLTITYSNANIDFIKEDKLINLSDIKNKNIVGSKKINNIFFKNGKAYVACDFGVVVINLSNFLIEETLFTNQNNGYTVYDILVADEFFYIFTSKGVYYIKTDLGTIANLNEWTLQPQFSSGTWCMAKPFNGGFVAAKGTPGDLDSLFLFRNDTLSYLENMSYTDLCYFDTKDDKFLLCNKSVITIYNSEFEEINSINKWWTFEYEDAQEAIFDNTNDNIIWIADIRNGLIKADISGETKSFHIDGPYSSLAYKMNIYDNALAVVPGSCAGYNAPKYVDATLSHYHDGQWDRYHRSYYSELLSINASDLCCVAINPRNKDEIYTGSWKDGIIKFESGKTPFIYNPENSTLQYSAKHSGYDNFTLVSDICFDGNNNLWVTNSFCNYPLSVLQSNGSWKCFNIGVGSSAAVAKIHIDSRGYKWLTLRNNDNTWRLLVFNDNNTIDNTSDDKIVYTNLNDYCNVNTSNVNCVTEDLDGKIWIGTEQGVKVIYNAANAFKSTPYAQNILIDANGNTQNLLEFESITDIEVDDANRKWIATEKAGAFLVSDAGTEELLHFTAENSPLPSNSVNDIAINRKNGEVFFATSAGIVSYRGNATEGKEDFSEVRVFPNPIKEDYNGVIAVTGLMLNSFCKITDASGHLIWQDYADGGQLNWNGKNFYGQRPATGVYYIFASDQTGKERKVAKLLFIK